MRVSKQFNEKNTHAAISGGVSREGFLQQMIDFATVITQRVKLLLSTLDASNVDATTAEVFQVRAAGVAPRTHNPPPSIAKKLTGIALNAQWCCSPTRPLIFVVPPPTNTSSLR